MNRINIEAMINHIRNKYGVEVTHSEILRGYEVSIPVRSNNTIDIYFIEEGACIRKPNGTKKYYYEISNAKFAKYINQIYECWK